MKRTLLVRLALGGLFGLIVSAAWAQPAAEQPPATIDPPAATDTPAPALPTPLLHCEAPAAYRQPDASVWVRPSTAGGLSPSTSNKWQGRGSVHLVCLPQVASTDPNAKYRIPVTQVITHEAGHNLFLCHAPADPSQPIAAGAQAYIHDKDDLLCLMNYDQHSDHLCGYCHLKLRGYGTVARGENLTFTGPIDDGLVKLWHDSTRNRKP